MSDRKQWIDDARSVRVENVLADRNIRLTGKNERIGPCPVCGGKDRFSINTTKQVFNCRGCGKGGQGAIDLVMFMDGIGIDTACEKLTGKPAPKPNGNAEAKPDWKHPEGDFVYHDEKGEVLYKSTRFPLLYADGSPAISAKGKRDKTFIQYIHDGGGWKLSKGNINAVPYKLPDIINESESANAAGDTPRFLIFEGEAKADLFKDGEWPISGFAIAATSIPKAAKDYGKYFAGADVWIVPDRDEPGRRYLETVATEIAPHAKSVLVVELPGLGEAEDVKDWLPKHNMAEFFAATESAQEWRAKGSTPEAPEQLLSPKLKLYDLSDFLALEIPPREMVLAPIIPEKGLVMLYAMRGCGKTHVGHGIGHAVACGGKFLKWTAPKPRRVLCVDGELPASELQSRLNQINEGVVVKPARGMFNLIPADLIEGSLGNLADPKVQAELDPLLEGIEFLILDNLSSLTTVIRDNDAESWNPIQNWLLRLRRRGISVLIIHHAGKDGVQRGTSRREDVLDTSISLRRPSDYVPTEGARFEIHIEKGRGIHGNDAKPFEAKLEVRYGQSMWTMRDIDDVNLARVAALLDDGLTVRDIADETGIPKSTVQRLKKKAEEIKKQSNETVD